MINTANENSDIILIVEDTAANYDVIKTFLNDIDVKCENAFDGMEAVTMCSTVDENHYSLILMDINLPYMDGFETTRRIRDLGIKTPIIAATATSRQDASIERVNALFDGLLFKPFSYLELYRTISPYIKNAMAYTLKLEDVFAKEKNFLVVDGDVCDVRQAVANMGNNTRLFTKHFDNFKNNNVDLVPRLQELMQKRQHSEAALLCHSIKGLSGMLGLKSLYGHIIDLEKCFKRKADEQEGMAVNVEKDVQSSLDDEIYKLLISIGRDIRLVCQIQF